MTLQKSNVDTTTILMAKNPSLEERHVIAAAEVGINSANQSLSEVLDIYEVCNFKTTYEGYVSDGTKDLYLSPYESEMETYETNLYTSVRKSRDIRTNVSPQTQLSLNSLYILTQGSLIISYEDGENETISSFVGENWSSEYPNFKYSVNCNMKLSRNSSLFVINLSKPISSYDIKHIQFNGTIDKILDSDTTVIVKQINTGAGNNLVYINGEICRGDLICNGNISLNSSGNALSILLKNKE